MGLESVIEITIGTQTVTLLSVEYQVTTPPFSDTEPTPTAGYTVLPTPIELDGIKLWVEYRVV